MFWRSRASFLTDKSVLTPTQEMTWLGSVWNGKAARIRLPEEKILAIEWLARSLAAQGLTDLEQWERFLGHLAFAVQVCPLLGIG